MMMLVVKMGLGGWVKSCIFLYRNNKIRMEEALEEVSN